MCLASTQLWHLSAANWKQGQVKGDRQRLKKPNSYTPWCSGYKCGAQHSQPVCISGPLNFERLCVSPCSGCLHMVSPSLVFHPLLSCSAPNKYSGWSKASGQGPVSLPTERADVIKQGMLRLVCPWWEGGPYLSTPHMSCIESNRACSDLFVHDGRVAPISVWFTCHV